MDNHYFGELPVGDVLFVACDYKYYVQFGKAFIDSALAHGNRVHVHIINPPVGSYVRDERFTMTWEEYAPTSREYYASSRFHMAPELLMHSPGCRLMILDIDSIVRGKVSFPDAAVGLYFRTPFGASDWERRGTRVAAGIVYYDHTAWYFSRRVSDRIRTLPQQWFVDQVALAETADEFYQGLKVHNFSEDTPSVLDWEFREDSIVWSGKGERKYNDRVYLEEFDKWNT